MRISMLIVLILLFSSNRMPAQNTILWSVQKGTNPTTTYLLGTFHQMGNSFIDSIPQIKESLLKSDLAIFETVEHAKNLISYLNSRPEDHSYQNYLKKQDINLLLEISKAWPVPISKLKPIEILIKLDQEYVLKNCGTMKRGDQWNHFEKYLIDIAKQNNVEILGLENDSIQTKDINDMGNHLNWNEAEKHIHRSLNNFQASKGKKESCYHAQQYMKFLNDYQLTEKCADTALISRNKSWIKKLLPNLESKNLFIAVGILHLYGDCGIIMLLRNLGYTVIPIVLKKLSP